MRFLISEAPLYGGPAGGGAAPDERSIPAASVEESAVAARGYLGAGLVASRGYEPWQRL